MFSTEQLLFFAFGLAFGLFSFNQIIYPVFCLFTKFKSIQMLTRLNTSALLYTIIRIPIIWILVVLGSYVLVLKFIPEHKPIYLFSLGLALVVVFIQIPFRNRTLEKDFMAVLRDMLGITEEMVDPDQKYPRFSVVQMRMMDWKAHDIRVPELVGLLWECAECGEVNRLKEEFVYLQGSGKRYVVKCFTCMKPSILRVVGFMEQHLTTEARVPDFESERQMRKTATEPRRF